MKGQFLAHTGWFKKNYRIEKTKVLWEFFHFIKFQGKMFIFPENYGQPVRFAYIVTLHSFEHFFLLYFHFVYISEPDIVISIVVTNTKIHTTLINKTK